MDKIDEQVKGRLQARHGLRRKFVVGVVIPPLIPFVILAMIAYVQLTGLIRNALVEQLTRSAATTSAKLEREVSIRSTIAKKTAEDIFTIKKEFNDKKDALTKNRNDCKQSSFDFIQNTACEPFLAEFAKLSSPTGSDDPLNYSSTRNTAIDRGYTKQVAALNTEEGSKINDRLNAFKLFFPEIEAISITDKTGKLVTENGNQELVKKVGPSDQELQTVTENEAKWVWSSYDIESGNIKTVYSTSHEGYLKPAWESAPRSSKNDLVYILDQGGSVLYPSVSPSEKRDVVFQGVVKSKDPKNGDYILNDNGQALIAKASRVPHTDWSVVVASPAQEILEPLRSAQTAMLIAILVTILATLLVGFIFVSSATNSIKKLLSGALQFAQGNLDHKIKLNSKDELQALSETMNDMAGQIKTAEETLDQKNKEFISIASHELKAPMTSIIGYLDMITHDGMGKVDEEARKLIDQAYEGTVRLRNLVSELLDIARLESGKVQFDIKPTDIVAETKAIMNMQAIPAKQKNITLNLLPIDNLPKVLADQSKLQIVLTNFVSNAIKYNRQDGSVTVGFKVESDRLVVSISDTGLGIPKDQQAKMFEKFFRVNSPDRTSIKGTGLGMYITKQFIEAMDGKLWFESEEGKGTTFYFGLPVYRA